MRRFLPLFFSFSIGLVLTTATGCGTGEPDAGTSNGAGSEGSLLDADNTEACTILSGPQPSGCTYGSFCGFGGVCQPVPTPVCENLRNSSHTWNPATSSGPIIYAVEQVSFASDTTYCSESAPLRIRVRVQAYSPSGGLPTTASGLASVFRFVNVNGMSIPTAGLNSNVVTSADQKNTEFQVSLCVGYDRTTASLGFYFEGGNGFCFIARR